MGDGNRPNGPKKKAQLREGVDELKRKWRDEDQFSDSKDVIFNGAAHKRVKTNGDLPNGHKFDHEVAESTPQVSVIFCCGLSAVDLY